MVQPGLNTPLRTAKIQEAGGRGFRAAEAGNAKFHFIRSTIGMSAAPPLKFASQLVDLSQPRPSRIGVKHLTRRDRADFQPAMQGNRI
jgi:hypothetical protein